VGAAFKGRNKRGSLALNFAQECMRVWGGAALRFDFRKGNDGGKRKGTWNLLIFFEGITQ